MRSISSPLDGFSSPFGARRLGGGVSPFALYAANGFTPPLVADYKNEVYAVDGVASTFDDMHTYAGASLKTMVDSDGALKWPPHTLHDSEENPTSTFNSAKTINAGVDPAGGGKAVSVTSIADGVANFGFSSISFANRVKHVAWVKKSQESNFVYVFGSGSNTFSFNLDLRDGAVSNSIFGAGATGAVSATDSGSGWYKVVILRNEDGAAIGGSFIIRPARSADDGSSALAGDGFLIWGMHSHRNDLGGMVNNPDTGDSYVPTTTASRYLPRRGNHVWDGAEWVNEGVLIESAAATNLLLNSGTLATQSVTVTAVPHTLHFTGTGTVTLTGASTAGPLVGTGAGEENRTSLTFTPTAGSLTLTVSGTVTNADLIVGSTLQSHIPTAGATATRAAETRPTKAAVLPAITTAVSGSHKLLLTYADTNTATQQTLFDWRADASNRITLTLDTAGANTGKVTLTVVDGGTSSSVTSTNQIAAGINVAANVAWRVTDDFINIALNGTAATQAANTATVPDLGSANAATGITGNDGLGLIWAEDIGDTGTEEASA